VTNGFLNSERSSDLLALRSKLRGFKRAIRSMDPAEISDEISRRAFADTEFFAQVIAALELAHRKNPDRDAVLQHACAAMDRIWASPLDQADNEMCQLMIFVALTKSRVWPDVKDHFGERFPPRLKFHEASHWVRSILEFSRRVVFRRRKSDSDATYDAQSSDFSVNVTVGFNMLAKA
jgi:hypothetical protein